MEAPELIRLLRRHGVERLAAAVNSPAVMLAEGWDLTAWSVRTAAGAVLFARSPAEERILCVNAGPEDEPRWRQIVARDPDAALTTLLMAPGGKLEPDDFGRLGDEDFDDR